MMRKVRERKKLYHGSPHRLDEIRPATATGKGEASAREHAIYLASSPEEARLYALTRPRKNKRKGWAILNGKVHYVKGDPINKQGYVYEHEFDDYAAPPESDPGIGYRVYSAYKPSRRKRVRLRGIEDRFVEHPDKASYKALLHGEFARGVREGVEKRAGYDRVGYARGHEWHGLGYARGYGGLSEHEKVAMGFGWLGRGARAARAPATAAPVAQAASVAPAAGPRITIPPQLGGPTPQAAQGVMGKAKSAWESARYHTTGVFGRDGVARQAKNAVTEYATNPMSRANVNTAAMNTANNAAYKAQNALNSPAGQFVDDAVQAAAGIFF